MRTRDIQAGLLLARMTRRAALLLPLPVAAGCATQRLGAVADVIPPLSPGTGAIAGRVVDDVKGKPIAGVSVVVSGPGGEQTEFTDSDGRYAVTDLLPSSENVVRFFLANVSAERLSVTVPEGAAVMVDAVVPVSKIKLSRGGIVCYGEPNIEVYRSDQSTSVTTELTRNAPVP